MHNSALVGGSSGEVKQARERIPIYLFLEDAFESTLFRGRMRPTSLSCLHWTAPFCKLPIVDGLRGGARRKILQSHAFPAKGCRISFVLRVSSPSIDAVDCSAALSFSPLFHYSSASTSVCCLASSEPKSSSYSTKQLRSTPQLRREK